MNKQYFFLSGIARSGSTLLGSILNQNPDIYVSPTSPLMDFFCLMEQTLSSFQTQYTFDYNQTLTNFNQELTSTFYKHINKPYVFDKHRGWPRNIPTMIQAFGHKPKIICTWRPVAENIVSFLKLINKDPNNSVDMELRKKGLELTTRNRAIHLWRDYSSDPYDSLKYGLQVARDCIHIVDYHKLVNDTSNEIIKIYNFLEIPQFIHSYHNITNTCSEVKDDAWGFKGLHDIRSNLKVTSDDPKDILGAELFEYFNKFDAELNL